MRYTIRVNVGSIAVPNADSASWTTGTKAAARIATMPTTKLTPVADEARAAPRVPRARASSSVVRASESASPDNATTSSARTASGTTSIVVPRRSLLASRWIVTRRMPTPNRTSVHGTTGRGRVPVVATCASAAIIVNATASTKQRAPMRIATAALARTAELRRMQHVEDDAPRAKMRGHRAVRGRDADAQDPVVRATEREHRARQAGRDLRR